MSKLFDEDYDNYYSEYQLKLCGGSSVFIVESLNGVIHVLDDLTTDNSTVERSSLTKSEVVTQDDDMHDGNHKRYANGHVDISVFI